MRCTIPAVLAAVVVLGCSSSASAVWVDSVVHYVETGYHRNVEWPWPFICPDRMAVRAPFDMMVKNGWRRQNLLGDHHFDPETHELNTAGELKVQWIMTQVPTPHRQIFVERSIEPSVTSKRMASAQEYAQVVAIDGQTPQVFGTHLLSEGRPAQIVDLTNVRFLESMPAPVLPDRDSSTFDND